MELLRIRARSLSLPTLYLLVGGVFVAGYYLGHSPFGLAGWVPHVFCDLAVSFSAFVAVLVGVVRYRPVRRAAWLWIAVSQLVYFSGDALFFTFHEILNDFRYPAPSELFYLAYKPILAVGLLMLGRGRLRERVPLIDTLIIGTAASLLVWIFLMSPYAAGTMGLPARLTSLAFPVLDLMIIVVGLHVFVSGLRTRSTYLLAIFLGSLLFADFAYGWMQIHGSYTNTNFVSGTWLVSCLFLGAAALHPSMRQAGVLRQPRATDLTRRKLLLLAAASMVAPAVLIEDQIDGDSAVFPGALASIILFLLVVARLADAAQRQRRLIASLEQAEVDKARLVARLVETGERERARLAIDLHDGPIQQLTALAFSLDLLVSRIERGDIEAARGGAAKVREHIAAEISSLRGLMTELRPPLLDERGLAAALEDCSRQVLGDGISCRVDSNIAGIRLAVELEAGLYRIAREALINIRKHADAHTIVIELDRRGDSLHLLLRDDGEGFDRGAAILELDKGLSGMQELAESIGGRCRILSTPGEGTNGRDRRSLEGPRESAGRCQHGGGGRVSARDKTVLIAEDDDLVREAVRTYLEEAGYATLDAASVTEALAVAAKHAFVDVLITDLVMPDGDGFELATRLVRHQPTVRVLFTSGYADMRWTGAYLAKPFTGAELVEALEDLVLHEPWSPASASTPARPSQRDACRVVVVDDDDRVRTVLCELLREEGCDVVGEGRNGLEAVSLASELSPDVMVLDVRMPNLGGLEAAGRIRLSDARVRFVMLSAYDDATLQQEGRDVGATAFLVKGCSLQELVAAVVAD